MDLAKQAQLKQVPNGPGSLRPPRAAVEETVTADQMFRMIGSNLESTYARSLEVMERYELPAVRTSNKPASGRVVLSDVGVADGVAVAAPPSV